MVNIATDILVDFNMRAIIKSKNFPAYLFFIVFDVLAHFLFHFRLTRAIVGRDLWWSQDALQWVVAIVEITRRFVWLYVKLSSCNKNSFVQHLRLDFLSKAK